VSRLDREAIIGSVTAALSATPDPDGVVDLIVREGRVRGRISVAASAAELGPAIERLKPLDGYRWLAINGADLFAASPKTIGTKVGILDPAGKVLKAADLPRAR
jgi:hypothetical protein